MPKHAIVGLAAHMNSLERSCRRQARRKLARKRRQYEAPYLQGAGDAMATAVSEQW